MKAEGRGRFLGLSSLLVRAAWRATASRFAALLLGTLVVASVLFSPNGMRTRDLTKVASEVFAVRAGLWAAWLLAALPLARALLHAPGIAWLRSIPISRFFVVAVLGALLLPLQAPWTLLWGVGAGVVPGFATTLAAAAIEALALARPRRFIEVCALSALLFAILWPLPWALILAFALPLWLWGVWLAWTRVPERPSHSTTMVRGPLPLALASSYLARLLRVEPGLLGRGVLVALAGGLFAALGAKNRGELEAASFVDFFLCVSALFLVIGTSGVAGAVHASARRLSWLLDATGVRAAPRILAERGVVGAWGTLLGLIMAAEASLVAGVGSLALLHALAFGGAWGGALGVLASEAATRASQKGEIDAGRLVASLAAIGMGALILAGWLGRGALLIAGLLALLLPLFTLRARSRWSAPSSFVSDDDKLGAMSLEVRELRKLLSRRWVLDRVDLSWTQPGTLVVFGENGAGKSTLIKVVCGVIDKDSGEIVIGGHSLSRERESALAAMGYVPDDLDLPGYLSVRELLTLGAALKRANFPDAASIERLGIGLLLSAKLDSLSLGQRRRVGLCLALVGEPRLLVLDEPTNGLDAEGQSLLVELLRERRERGVATLVATHDRAFIDAAADAVAVLEGGRVRL